jgi:hypothetical protein
MWLPKTIRGEFAFLALSLALPLVGLIGYGLYDRARDEFAAAEALASQLAQSNADRAAEYVAGLRGTLEAIARRPLVRAMDATSCDPLLGDVVALYPRAASLIVVDADGVIVCSSNPLPHSARGRPGVARADANGASVSRVEAGEEPLRRPLDRQRRTACERGNWGMGRDRRDGDRSLKVAPVYAAERTARRRHRHRRHEGRHDHRSLGRRE